MLRRRCVLEDTNDRSEMATGVDGEDGARRPVSGGGSDEEAGDTFLAGSSSSSQSNDLESWRTGKVRQLDGNFGLSGIHFDKMAS